MEMDYYVVTLKCDGKEMMFWIKEDEVTDFCYDAIHGYKGCKVQVEKASGYPWNDEKPFSRRKGE